MIYCAKAPKQHIWRSLFEVRGSSEIIGQESELAGLHCYARTELYGIRIRLRDSYAPSRPPC